MKNNSTGNLEDAPDIPDAYRKALEQEAMFDAMQQLPPQSNEPAYLIAYHAAKQKV